MKHWKAATLSLLALVAFSGGEAAENDYPVTDLVAAAKTGDGHAIHHLIEADADLSVRGPMGYTALHWAGVRGNWKIFAELLAAGAPVNAIGSDGGTPLHWASHHDRPDMIELLLESGADLEVSNRWGRTPLHVASRRGCLEVAALLLARGSDANARTNEGWTPLHVAARSGHARMMEVLAAADAGSDRVDHKGQRPASLWRDRPPSIEIDTAALDDYVGLYELGGGLKVKFWRERDGLHLREFAPDVLYPIGRDTFFCQAEPWRVRFTRNEVGAVQSVAIDFLRRTVRATKTRSPRYIGSRACMSCHLGKENGNQFVTWLRSRHAHAYWRLGADWAMFLARLRPHYSDLKHPIDDHRCRLCHVTGEQDEDALFAQSFRSEEGIGCESCHGPGSDYIDPVVMTDREAFLANGGRVPDRSTCFACHRNPDAFDWREKWSQIAHVAPVEQKPDH